MSKFEQKKKKKSDCEAEGSLSSPWTAAEMQVAVPTRRGATQLSRERTLKTTGLEKVRGFLISLLSGHFSHSNTTSGPFMEKALSTFGVSAVSPF